ncbi:MAG: DUF547 domain-containing protein [Syntrophomonadaceae bacterium]
MSLARTLGSAATAFVVLLGGATAAPAPDPAVWDAILDARARSGGFDYRGATGQDRKRLAAYLANVGDADPAAMAPEERKAFWINAYNAAAVALVLDHYPVASIRDVDGAFDRVRRRLGGAARTLDDVENLLRATGDARIHFAIVCASRSCPPLRPRAYVASGLSEALDMQGRAFLADPSKNVIDRARGRVALSKIFLWDRKEFERDGGTLLRFVARFVQDPGLGKWLETFPGSPEFLDYDWALNQP